MRKYEARTIVIFAGDLLCGIHHTNDICTRLRPYEVRKRRIDQMPCGCDLDEPSLEFLCPCLRDHAIDVVETEVKCG